MQKHLIIGIEIVILFVGKHGDVVKHENDEVIENKVKLELEFNNEAKVKVRKERPHKHRWNIIELMKNSNATPIKNHKGIGYTCCFCNREFPEAADLKKHTLENHDSDTYKKASFLKRMNMSRYHVKLDITNLKCKLCDTAIEDLEKLMKHLIDNHKKIIHMDIKNHILPFKFETDTLKCFMCDSVFHKFKVLHEHMGVHYRNYTCDTCGVSFVNFNSLANHKLSHKTGRFPCRYCDVVLDTIVKKRNHEKGHTLKHKCVYCPETFKDYRQKEDHLVKLHNLKVAESKCQACGKVYSNRKLLQVHIKQVHLMFRPHKCTECDMKFFSDYELKRHVVKHTKLRQFKCPVCLKSYPRKRTLVEHLRIHNNDRRYRCELCGQAFVQKCSLRGHIKSKHREHAF